MYIDQFLLFTVAIKMFKQKGSMCAYSCINTCKPMQLCTPVINLISRRLNKKGQCVYKYVTYMCMYTWDDTRTHVHVLIRDDHIHA